MKTTYEKIIKYFHLKDEDIINVYPFGSQIYKTANYNSDEDFIIVVKNSATNKDLREKSHKLNINIFNENRFVEKLKEHKMAMLECISLPQELMLKNSKQFTYKLDIKSLQNYILPKSQDDWYRAMKSCWAGDFMAANKSIFHALRSLTFATQMIKYGKIIDYTEANLYWADLQEFNKTDWDWYEEYFGVVMTNLIREIKKIMNNKCCIFHNFPKRYLVAWRDENGQQVQMFLDESSYKKLQFLCKDKCEVKISMKENNE